MNISTGKQYSLQRKNPFATSGVGSISPSKNNKNVTFGANITRHLNRKTAQVVFDNAFELIGKIDDSLGKGYFSGMLDEAGIIFNKNENILSYKDRTIGQDLLKTAEAIVDIPIRLVNSIAQKLDVKYKTDGFMDKWLQRKNHQKTRDKALDIIEEFIRPRTDLENPSLIKKITNYVKNFSKTEEMIIDSELCDKVFKNNSASNIAKVKKNYESRDERALNRIVTASVSSLYAANDFYNISMLQKDDDKEAKKAHDKKLKQELRRMALSASLTFISLGALDRYTKKNIVINAVVIAISTLISEVYTRIKSGYSLIPLSPEQAAKKAQKNNEKAQETKNKQVAFKANLKNEKEIYKNFVQKDGNLILFNSAANNKQNETKVPNSKKKKMSIAGIIASISAAASVTYLILNALKGKFAYNAKKAEFFAKHKDELLSGKILKQETIDELIEVSKKYGKDKFAPFDKIKKFITKKEVTVEKNTLEKQINELVEYAKEKKKEDVVGVLNNYKKHIQETFKDTNEVTTKIERPIATGVYKGVTKIFDTLYTVLSLPGVAISKILNSKNSEACRIFDKLLEQNKTDYEKELAILDNIFTKAKNKDDIIETISKRVRNVEIGAETSDLANLSRTMVTLLTTYFFVNDYRNEVLIESGGKDIDGAEEEMKERLLHKISNFIINGTLMNTFNTIFINPLNRSLVNAAIIAGATETVNETLVRKSICQPIGKKKSKQDIIDHEEKQITKKGFMGWWSRTFRKITGKKTLTQKAGINTKTLKEHQG